MPRERPADLPLKIQSEINGPQLEAERGGFSPTSREKPLQMLYSRIKALSDLELERLQALLVIHGFLPS